MADPPVPEMHTPPPEVRQRKILVALDEGEESIHALDWALHNLILPFREGQKSSDAVVLLHVQAHPQAFVGPAYPGIYMTPAVIDSLRKQQEETSKRVLLRAKTNCDEKHIQTQKMVAIGDPRDGICEAVDKLHPDFLVIGSHGYGAIKRAFLGSVSNYCAHNAKCPLVIVKKP